MTDLYICCISFLAIGAAVGAVVIVAVVALLLIIILWKCKRTTKGIVISRSTHLIAVIVILYFSIFYLMLYFSEIFRRKCLYRKVYIIQSVSTKVVFLISYKLFVGESINF